MSNLFYLAGQILNRPLLVTPEQARLIYSAISNPDNIKFNERDMGMALGAPTDRSGERTYQVIDRKTAVVPVIGSLINRGNNFLELFGFTSYERLKGQINEISEDDSIETVIFDFDSPGGEATGCLELATLIRNLSKKKKTISVVNGLACSAAYALASATSEIYTTPSSSLGSIGVVYIHIDQSKQLDLAGVKPTFVYAGQHKIDCSPFAPLSDEMKADMQVEINGLYDAFIATVAKGRGKKLSVADARNTEAQIFIGKAAVDKGLADKVDTFDNVLAAVSRPSQRPTTNTQKGNFLMDTDDNAAAKAIEGVRQQDCGKTGMNAQSQDTQEGEKKAYGRIEKIMSCDAIKSDAKKLQAAVDLAVKAPSMSVEDVITFVSENVAEEKATSPASLASRLAAPENDILSNAISTPQTEQRKPLTALAMLKYGKENGTV